MAVELEQVGDGVWKAPGARIIDRSGRRRMPIGRDGFVPAMRGRSHTGGRPARAGPRPGAVANVRVLPV